MVEVVGTAGFEAWFMDLDGKDSEAVAKKIDLLGAVGVALPFPHQSALKGSAFRLRELRVQSAGKPLRIAYGFDTKRQAVVLLGADKTGQSTQRFYEWFVAAADSEWIKYLKEVS
jgi:hypothetical protein